MNVSFTAKQEDYIANQVASGDYQNASEVVREALRLHEVYRQRMLNELRTEIAKGCDAAESGRSVKEIIAGKLKQRG